MALNATYETESETSSTAQPGHHTDHESERKIDPFDVHDPDWNFEKILPIIIDRGTQEGAGPVSPHVTLSWKDLSIYGNDVGMAVQEDVLSTFPSLITKARGLCQKPPEKTILSKIDGLLAPGEMLLVLGPPSSGCTTLLKVLSGQLDGYRRWCGSISYSGIPVETMCQRFASMLTFNDAIDYHLPYLTVSQTLEFAASTKTPRMRFDGMSRQQYIEGSRDILMKLFGLKHTANTRVGNDFVRGVSGGERRRVSIAEMVCTRSRYMCCLN